MAFQLPEPPAWWIKYKPLRWVLAALVLVWFFGTLLPRLRTAEPPAAQAPDEAEAEVVTAQGAPEPEPEPEAPPPPKPEPPPPKPAPKPLPPPKPAPVVEPEPEPAPQTEARTEPVEFMDSLRSYDSLEAAQASLGKAGYRGEVESINLRFRNDTLTIGKYRHDQFEGKLTLEFFNDRLYQAEFEPKQPADYLRWLRDRGFSLPKKRTGRTTLERGFLRLSTNIDFASSDVGRVLGERPFVLWEDTRLAQQLKDAR